READPFRGGSPADTGGRWHRQAGDGSRHGGGIPVRRDGSGVAAATRPGQPDQGRREHPIAVYPLQQVHDADLRWNPVRIGGAREPAWQITASGIRGVKPMSGNTVADLLLARVGDTRPGMMSREATWTWDEVVAASAARAELARARRIDGPFHIGVLLDNVPEYVFWLGAAALAGATVVGINPTRGDAELEQEVAQTDCQFVVTDRAGAAMLSGLDIGVPPARYLLIDRPGYADEVAAHAEPPRRDPGVTDRTRMLLLFTSGTTGASKAAICSQGRLARLGERNSSKYRVDADDVCYCPMPLFHGN